MPTDKQKHTEIASEIPCGLKPCPFCGGEAELADISTHFWVRCKICECETQIRDSLLDAGLIWNTRADVSPWVAIEDIPKEWKDGRRLMLNTPWGVVFGKWSTEEPASDCARAIIYAGWQSEGGETWPGHNMGDQFEAKQHGQPTHAMLPVEPPKCL